MLRKKIGAGFLSLAMLSSVGLHNTAFADPDPTTDYNITVNDGDGDAYGNSTATFTSGVNDDPTTAGYNEAVQPQSEASIRGWQTEEPEGYAVNVTWGDMVFVYDRGRFNPETGLLERATNVAGVEAGEGNYTTENNTRIEDKVNKWYGFDGVNNRITCQNISTGDINVSTTVTSDTTNNPNVTCRLLKLTRYVNDLWGFSPEDSDDVNGYWWDTCSFGDVLADELFAGSYHKLYYVPNGISTPLIAPDRGEDGSIQSNQLWVESTGSGSGGGDDFQIKGYQASFFVNITGTPATTLTTNSTNPAVIGSITLTFSKRSSS